MILVDFEIKCILRIKLLGKIENIKKYYTSLSGILLKKEVFNCIKMQDANLDRTPLEF